MIKAIQPDFERKQKLFDLLESLGHRVKDGKIKALLVAEVRTNEEEVTMLHDAGDISYAEIVGYLEMMKMDMHAKAAGLIQP